MTQATRAQLRKALEFYANEDRYDYDQTCCFDGKVSGDDILADRGEVARKVLAEHPDPVQQFDGAGERY